MSSAISTAIKTAQGSRASQEDFARTAEIAGGSAQLLVLADGVGGGVSGERAAKQCVDEFILAAQRGELDDPEARPESLLRLLENANRRIYEYGQEFAEHRGMATTVVVAILTECDVEWISVGDSHLYVVRRDGLIKLNADHSLRGQAETKVTFQAPDGVTTGRSNELLSAVAGRQIPLIDAPQAPYAIAPTDVCLLASDGLDTLAPDEIHRVVVDAGIPTARGIAATLLDAVLRKRAIGQDNISILVGCNETALKAAMPASESFDEGQGARPSARAGGKEEETDTVPLVDGPSRPAPETAAVPRINEAEPQRAAPAPKPRQEDLAEPTRGFLGIPLLAWIGLFLLGMFVAALGSYTYSSISTWGAPGSAAGKQQSGDKSTIATLQQQQQNQAQQKQQWEVRSDSRFAYQSSEWWQAGSLDKCKEECLRDRDCAAVSFRVPLGYRRPYCYLYDRRAMEMRRNTRAELDPTDWVNYSIRRNR